MFRVFIAPQHAGVVTAADRREGRQGAGRRRMEEGATFFGDHGEVGG